MVRVHTEKIGTPGRRGRAGIRAPRGHMRAEQPARAAHDDGGVMPARPLRILSCLLLISLLMVRLMWPAAAAAEQSGSSGIKRLCILVGANDGGPERETLRYAVSDALALRRVFTTMGGIEAQDCVLQVNPNKAEL